MKRIAAALVASLLASGCVMLDIPDPHPSEDPEFDDDPAGLVDAKEMDPHLQLEELADANAVKKPRSLQAGDESDTGEQIGRSSKEREPPASPARPDTPAAELDDLAVYLDGR